MWLNKWFYFLEMPKSLFFYKIIIKEFTFNFTYKMANNRIKRIIEKYYIKNNQFWNNR